METIKFETKKLRAMTICITPCPYDKKYNGAPFMVGSFTCRRCQFNIETDRENKIVICVYGMKKNEDN